MIVTVVCLSDRENKTVNYRSDYNQTEGTEPRVRSSSFQTCKVTYGGIDGAYYTSTRARRTGSDGVSKPFLGMLICFRNAFCFNVLIPYQVLVEESKEADKSTGQATHRISRGINDKVIIVHWISSEAPIALVFLFI